MRLLRGGHLPFPPPRARRRRPAAQLRGVRRLGIGAGAPERGVSLESVRPLEHVRIGYFFLAFSALCGVAFVVGRLGFPRHGALVLLAVGLSAVLHLGPALLARFTRAPSDFTGGAVNLLALAFIGILIGLSYLPPPVGRIVLAALAAICVFATLPALRGFTRSRFACDALLLLVSAGAFLGRNLYRYHPPISLEEAHHGDLILDSLYHFSITQMIKFFGTPSIGVDGILQLRYHTGSHYLLARLDVLLGGEVPITYPLLSHVVLVPLLLRTAVSFAADVAERRGGGVSWRVVVAWTLGLLFAAGSIEWDSYLYSNSYLCSLVLFMTAVWPALYVTLQGPEASPKARRLAFAALLAVYPFTVLCKVSTGFSLALLGGYLMLRSEERSWRKAVFLIALAGISAVVFPLVFAEASQLHFAPFLHYYRRFLAPGYFFFLVVINIFTLAYIFLRLVEARVTSWRDLRSAARERRLVDAEALALVTVCGMVPPLLFNHWFSYQYFDSVQMWIALPPIAGILSRGWIDLRARRGAVLDSPRARAVAVLVVLLLAPLLNSVALHLKRGFDLWWFHIRPAVEKSCGVRPGRAWLRDPRMFAQLWRPCAWQPSFGRELTERVLALRGRYGRSLAVYVPPTNQAYWNIHKVCASKALLIPALTGVPLIDGMPPASCRGELALEGSHVYEDYPERAADRDLDDRDLCERALARGFGVVLRVRGEEDTGGDRLLECSRPGSRNRLPTVVHAAKAG